MRPEIDQVSLTLTNHYKPENYSNEELDSIQMYTGMAYSDVNQRLISLPTGIDAKNVQPTSPDDYVPGIIANMDSAIAKSKSPMNFTVYTGLGGNYDPTQFSAGQEMIFKSYRSTSLNPNVVLNTIGRHADQSVAVFQIQVQKGSNGIYAGDFSQSSDEYEYILPRGAKIKIVDGPLRSVGSNQFTAEPNLQVSYFNCILVK
jgi:hypothetical protein